MEFNAYFDADIPEDEFDTIGGLVLKKFERLPRRGEKTTLYGFKVTILNADNRSVRLLKFEKVKAKKRP